MNRYERIKFKFYKLKRHWLTLAFVLGFVVDNLTLNRIDETFDNIILFSYVILAMVGLTLLYAGIAGKLGERASPFMRAYAPLLVQYSFGGLLSGMLIFYGRSGTIYDSWPFIFLILGVIYANETIRNREERLVYNLSIFFVGMYAYMALVIPVLLGKMGVLIFILSGFAALVVMHLFVKLLYVVVPNFMLAQQRRLVFVIGLIFVTFNVFYFTNIIPPIPLSLKDVGIFHSVVRFDDGTYQVTYEKPAWWQFMRNSDKTFHYEPGDNIYCFASVFAPNRLITEVYHKWEFLDTETGEWREHGRFSYAISGGRGNGYRGYTLIKNYTEGTWRCTVETERGQVIGRETFTVLSGERPELTSRIVE